MLCYELCYSQILPPSIGEVVRAAPSIPAWLLPDPTVEGLPAVVAPSATAGTVVTSATGGSQVTTSPPLGASYKIVRPFHNPTILPIPPHVVKAIQNGKYIALVDLLPEALSEAFDKAQQEGKEDTAKPKKKHPRNTPINWELAFSTSTAVSTHLQPEQQS